MLLALRANKLGLILGQYQGLERFTGLIFSLGLMSRPMRLFFKPYIYIYIYIYIYYLLCISIIQEFKLDSDESKGSDGPKEKKSKSIKIFIRGIVV